MKTDTAKFGGGCGGNCACARADAEKSDKDECVSMPLLITLDKEGKCPCGKTLDACCHKEDIVSPEDDAIGELCSPHNGKEVC